MSVTFESISEKTQPQLHPLPMEDLILPESIRTLGASLAQISASFDYEGTIGSLKQLSQAVEPQLRHFKETARILEQSQVFKDLGKSFRQFEAVASSIPSAEIESAMSQMVGVAGVPLELAPQQPEAGHLANVETERVETFQPSPVELGHFVSAWWVVLLDLVSSTIAKQLTTENLVTLALNVALNVAFDASIDIFLLVYIPKKSD